MKNQDASLWYYLPSWKRLSKNLGLKNNFGKTEKANWLLFLDGNRLGKYVLKRLQLNSQKTVVVKRGNKFKKADENFYKINPENESDYWKLLNDLNKNNCYPDYIIHFWNNIEDCIVCKPIKNIDSNLFLSFFSLLFLAKAITKLDINKNINIGIITNNLYRVTGSEELASPEMSTMLGPSKVINKEIKSLNCKNIDFELKRSNWSTYSLQMDQLINEITFNDKAELVAFRGDYRWVFDYESIFPGSELLPADLNIQRVKKNGVYILAGGTGEIGIQLALYLAKMKEVNLVLVTNSTFPKKSEWSNWLNTHDIIDKKSNVIRKLKIIHALGSSVEICTCDITNEIETNSFARDMIDKYRQINGIVLAAGSPDVDLIKQKKIDVSYRIIDPKIFGTINLYKAFERCGLDMFVLFSSIHSIIPEEGYIDCSAAGNFLDGFANYYNSVSDTYIVSINWPCWKLPESDSVNKKFLKLNSLNKQSLYQKIHHSKVFESLTSILNTKCSQVIVSPVDLHSQDEKKEIKNKSLQKLF